MKAYKTAIFDMDGTVTKTERGVLNSFRYALDAMGYGMPDVPSRLFLGPPLSFSFSKYCGLKQNEVDEAIRLYRVYYADTGIFECELYDGMEELLRRLKARGVTLLIASSKPEAFVKRILEHFGIAELFSFVGGADMEEKRSEKPDVLRYTLFSAGVHDLTGVVMVGDRKYDILGAKEIGVDSIGVLYGYGDREELESAGATLLAETPPDIERLILNSLIRRG